MWSGVVLTRPLAKPIPRQSPGILQSNTALTGWQRRCRGGTEPTRHERAPVRFLEFVLVASDSSKMAVSGDPNCSGPTANSWLQIPGMWVRSVF